MTLVKFFFAGVIFPKTLLRFCYALCVIIIKSNNGGRLKCRTETIRISFYEEGFYE